MKDIKELVEEAEKEAERQIEVIRKGGEKKKNGRKIFL